MLKHITIGLFEAFETLRQAWQKKLKELLEQYGLMNKMISYVKDEGANLNVLTIVLKSIVNCEAIDVTKSLQGKCFEHAFFKACQHSTFDEKMCKDFIYVSIKSILTYLQNYITQPKKSKKDRQEWMKICIIVGLKLNKLNTPIKYFLKNLYL